VSLFVVKLALLL